jgi:hypothetical protein
MCNSEYESYMPYIAIKYAIIMLGLLFMYVTHIVHNHIHTLIFVHSFLDPLDSVVKIASHIL